MNIYEVLNKLNISYNEIEHGPVNTVDEAQYLKSKIKGTGCKNLFLTDNKNYYLVIIEDTKRVDIKLLQSIANTSTLKFSSVEDLKKVLGLTPGSVTPFGIINDMNNLVTLFIDKTLSNKKLLFHPNINTITINIDYDDFIKFAEYENHKCLFF